MLIEYLSDSDTILAPVFGVLEDGTLLIETDGCIEHLKTDVHDRGFRIIDGRGSAFWEDRGGIRAFPEWFKPYFCENLANGAAWEALIVKYYRELFMREFPRDDLEMPKYYGRGLVRCPKCGRSFEPLSFLGVVRCNGFRCRSEMNNPFYSPERLRESCEWGRIEYELPGPVGYYYARTGRYYPSPPGVWDLAREQIVTRLDDFRRRREERFRKSQKRW